MKAEFKVRLSKELHQQLVAEAAKRGRSLNREIVFRLATTLGEQGVQYGDAYMSTSELCMEMFEKVLHEFVASKLRRS